MSYLSIISEVKKASRVMDKIRKQMPFTVSRAINKTALSVRDNIRGEQLPKLFTLRNKFTQRSIRAAFSTKRDLVARVFSDAHYLKLQSAGGVKTPKGEALAIPISKQWKNKAKRIPKRIRPNTLMTSGNAFIGKTKSGDPAIVMRGKKKGRKKTLITMYSLKRSVNVKSRMDLDMIVNKVVPRAYPRHFSRSFDLAMRTAR